MPQDKVRWVYDTGVRYAWADPDILVDYLQAARERKYGHWNSVFTEMDEEWIHDRSTLPCLNCRVAFQDVGRRTDTRTVRASVIPPKTFLTNKAPYFLWPRGNERDEAYLLGILNSLPLDWYARRFVETNVNYHFLNAFPFPRPGDDEPRRKRVIDIAGRLAARGEPFEEWASAVGVDCGSINEDEELELIYELDAVAAQLYGLDRDQLVTVFETFHDNWNEFDDRVERTLGYHEDWQ